MKKSTVAIGATIAVLVILAFAVVGLIFAVPIVLMATIDYGLQSSLGYEATGAILEDQAKFVAEKQLMRGEFNGVYADDLAKNGIEVGQTTVAGDFVRTNRYIANLDNPAEVAAEGDYYNTESGELAVRFDDKVIAAENFVEELDSNPRLYAAFAKGTSIDAKFYYSDAVNKVYKDFGLSRNSFASYKNTSNVKEAREQFEKLFNDMIDKVAKVGLNGLDLRNKTDDKYDACMKTAKTDSEKQDCWDKYKSFSFTMHGSDFTNGEELAEAVAGGVVDQEQPTEKAVSLLNTVASANEPYIAAGTFLALEEGLNRARIDGDGPVNPLLTTLSEPNEATVTNVYTGENMTTKKSILGTRNFLGAVADHSYDVADAGNYSRDGIIKTTGGISSEVINRTTMATDDDEQFNTLIRMWPGGETDGVVGKASNRLSTIFYDDTFETTKTTIGGNRIPMGGSFLSNSINSRVLGAMPSDGATVEGYKQAIDVVLARRAEADRVTLSPFDASSKHTFLGNLMRRFGLILVQNFGNSSSVGSGVANSVVGLAGESLRSLTSDTVLASAKESYMMQNGDCPTAASAAGVVGDMYCTTHNTIDTSRMGWGLDEYKKALGGSIDDEGGIVEGEGLAQFINYGMGRETTVGIEDATVCDAWRSSGDRSWWDKFIEKLFKILDLHEACDEEYVDRDVATGARYTLSGENGYRDEISLYSSYVLYDTVSALLDGKESKVAAYKEQYYAKHPRDDSLAGVISRRSGISKADAEIALGYADYLNRLAQYKPETRYAFAVPKLELPERLPEPIIENQKLSAELAISIKEILYRDLRAQEKARG